MKTIPQIREELLRIANSRTMCPYYSRKIKGLVNSLYRRSPARRAKTEHQSVTPRLSRDICWYATRHPTESYASIGARFNVAIGRVSEAVIGKRAA